MCQAFFVRLFSAAPPETSTWQAVRLPGQGGAFYRVETPCQRLPHILFTARKSYCPFATVNCAFYADDLPCQWAIRHSRISRQEHDRSPLPEPAPTCRPHHPGVAQKATDSATDGLCAIRHPAASAGENSPRMYKPAGQETGCPKSRPIRFPAVADSASAFQAEEARPSSMSVGYRYLHR